MFIIVAFILGFMMAMITVQAQPALKFPYLPGRVTNRILNDSGEFDRFMRKYATDVKFVLDSLGARITAAHP